MEITDVLFAIVPILFVVVFISVFTVVIVTIVKGISSSHRMTGAVDRTISQAMDSISGGFQSLMLNNRGGVLIPQITADFPDFIRVRPSGMRSFPTTPVPPAKARCHGGLCER